MGASILEPFKITESELLTFGQLLRLKREQLGLGLVEAMEKSKVTGIQFYEKDTRTPTNKILMRLVSFYKLTKQEIDSCKPIDKKLLTLAAHAHRNRIATIIELLKETMAEVDKMDSNGFLANTLKKTALDNLKQSYDLLNDIDIIDRLI